MKELQNVWNLSAAMDFNNDRYKTANKNVNDLLSFSNVNKYTMETRSKTNVFEWCNL